MSISPQAAYAPASVANLSGKVALVTGGTRGIGRGVARALAAAGAKVVITGRNESAAHEVIAEIEAANGNAAFVAANFFDDQAVDSVVGEALAAFGGLDILVNNAGIDADAPALNYDLADWRRVLRFNLEVPFRLCQQAAHHFIAHGGGSIINIASVLGYVAVPEGISYVAAKHGLLGMTKNLAIEWGRLGVRVNAIAPGLIQTDMTTYVWKADAGAAYVDQRIPLGRIGQPQDIGGIAVFLASDAADFIHGHTVVADGGFLAT